jgi:hypothetical protein
MGGGGDGGGRGGGGGGLGGGGLHKQRRVSPQGRSTCQGISERAVKGRRSDHAIEMRRYEEEKSITTESAHEDRASLPEISPLPFSSFSLVHPLIGSSLHLLVELDHVKRWQWKRLLHNWQQVCADGTFSKTPSTMAFPEYLTLASREQIGRSGGGGGLHGAWGSVFGSASFFLGNFSIRKEKEGLNGGRKNIYLYSRGPCKRARSHPTAAGQHFPLPPRHWIQQTSFLAARPREAMAVVPTIAQLAAVLW